MDSERIRRIKELENAADTDRDNANKLREEYEELLGSEEDRRWEAARLIAEELDSGTTQRELAAALGCSRQVIGFKLKLWNAYGSVTERPRFWEAYEEISHAGAKRKGGGRKQKESEEDFEDQQPEEDEEESEEDDSEDQEESEEDGDQEDDSKSFFRSIGDWQVKLSGFAVGLAKIVEQGNKYLSEKDREVLAKRLDTSIAKLQRSIERLQKVRETL